MSDPSVRGIPGQRSAPSVTLAQELLQYLLSGRFAPGQRLPSERQLTEALSAGRSAVREAIKSLSLLGLVEQRVGDGTYLVRSSSDLLPRAIDWGLLLTETDTSHLLETRYHLEVWSARLAAQRRTDAHLRRLGSLVAAAGVHGRADALAGEQDLDARFHDLVVEMAANTVVANVLNTMQSLLRIHFVPAVGLTVGSAATRGAVLRAIEARNPGAAEAAMAAHLDDSHH